jgi:peptide subunit release factor 1 (eRF1)
MYNNSTPIIEMDMKELIEQLEQKTTDLFRDAHSQLDKGNKAAGLRARRTSLEMEPLLKQFRKMSLEIANDRRKY